MRIESENPGKDKSASMTSQKCFNKRDSREMTCLVTLNAETIAWHF